MFDSYFSLFLWLIAGLLTGRLIQWIFPNESTMLPGLPVMGNVVALGRLGVAFIDQARKKFGDVFTLSLCGKRMTFLFDPKILDAFFKSPDSEITFRPAVEQFTQRVFGLPSKEFFPKHSQVLRDLRHMLVPSELHAHATMLAINVTAAVSNKAAFPLDGTQIELYNTVRSTVFRAAVKVLFGDELMRIPPGGAEQLEGTFFRFEEGFELAASPLPHVLQPGFTSARADLVKWLGEAHRKPGFESTPAGQLVNKAELRTQLAPNMLLAILWASQANAVPATFWSLAFLLLPENKVHLDTVLSELKEEVVKDAGAIKQRKTPVVVDPSEKAAITQAAFRLSVDRKSSISRCVAEAVRLRVHSIDLRIAAADLRLASSTGEIVRLPKGRLMAICPFVSHHDPALYPPDAWRFDPDRQPLSIGNGTAIVTSVAGLSFGGGSYRCPGRFFAEMEVALIVQQILWQFHIKLEPRAAEPQSSGDAAQSPSSILVFLRNFLGDLPLSWGLGLFEKTHPIEKKDEDRSTLYSDRKVSNAVESWRHSGDTLGLLPPCNLIRLVGLKVPLGPCFVTLTSREG